MKARIKNEKVLNASITISKRQHILFIIHCIILTPIEEQRVLLLSKLSYTHKVFRVHVVGIIHSKPFFLIIHCSGTIKHSPLRYL